MRVLEAPEVYRARLTGGDRPHPGRGPEARRLRLHAPAPAGGGVTQAGYVVERRAASSHPHEVSIHSASRWKTRRSTWESKASWKHPSATRHPLSRTQDAVRAPRRPGRGREGWRPPSRPARSPRVGGPGSAAEPPGRGPRPARPHQHRRAGGQQARQQHPGPLAARHLEDAAVGQAPPCRRGPGRRAPSPPPPAAAHGRRPAPPPRARRRPRRCAVPAADRRSARRAARATGGGDRLRPRRRARPPAERGPARRCSRVVLPAPFGPQTATKVPGRISALTPSSTRRPPRRTRTPESSSAALMSASSGPRARRSRRTGARRRGRSARRA